MTSLAGTGPEHEAPLRRRREPGGSALVFAAGRCRAGYPSELVPRYGDMAWDVRGLRPAHTTSSLINFERLPAAWRGPMRRSLWALLNLEAEHGGKNGKRVLASGGSILLLSSIAFTFALWCQAGGVLDPSAIDDVTYEDYAAALCRLGYSREYVENRLKAIGEVAMAGQRIEGVALPTPPWVREGLEPFISLERRRVGDNLREPLSQDVMGPLLCWAVRFVTDFSEDILDAKAHRDDIEARVPRANGPESVTRIRQYLERLRNDGEPLPSCVDSSGRLLLAGHYAAALVDATPDSFRYYWLKDYMDVPLGAPATVLSAPKGRIGGKPWRERIAYEEVPALATLLHTAALIVVSYLTGMRPVEALTLRRGCCTPFQEADGRTVYAIHGRHFKHVKENGVAVPDGRLRAQPWYAVPLVARAIEVVERLHEDPQLWPGKPSWLVRGRVPDGSAMSVHGAAYRFREFIAAVNRLADSSDRSYERVPDSAPITIGAFRRTLAWFIVWQPGGDLAAGLQYGHLEPLITTQGYAGRSRTRGGMGDVIDMERLRRVVDSFGEAAEGLERGQRVSGPASGRYLERVAQFQERFEGRTLSTQQMKQLRLMPDLRIYESPTQFLTCVMDPMKALCLSESARSNGAAPKLNGCLSTCGNRARTDEHAARMRQEAQRLRGAAAAAALPEPMRIRQEQRAISLERQADKHDRQVGEENA